MPYKDPEKARLQNRESVRRYRMKNLERCREISRDWARTNAERHRANAKRWRLENPEKREGYCKANLTKQRAAIRDWAKVNRERIRENARRRRAALQGAPGRGVSRREWAGILETFGHRCAYCLGRAERLDLEHVIALSLGGEHDPDNVVPACGSCNSSKGPGTLIGWVLRKGAA